MKQMELFAGIGGFGLAGEWAGIESAVQVEWNPFCQKVLAKNFPNAQRYGDITKFDGTPFRGAIDIISGGFPCQPYSTAGKRLGKEDERHLWPEMLRVIREVAPRWVVGENVRGIVSWNGGVVFDEVQSDMEAAGYEVQAFILPACAVDAPHRRDRVWFVANSIQGRAQKSLSEPRKAVGLQSKPPNQFSRCTAFNGVLKKPNTGATRNGDGVPNWVDRIGALGNAIVPQIAFQIFKAIIECEALQKA